MADAQASGACGSNIVWVQVPSPASFFVYYPVTGENLFPAGFFYYNHKKKQTENTVAPVCFFSYDLNFPGAFPIFASPVLSEEF